MHASAMSGSRPQRSLTAATKGNHRGSEDAEKTVLDTDFRRSAPMGAASACIILKVQV